MEPLEADNFLPFSGAVGIECDEVFQLRKPKRASNGVVFKNLMKQTAE